MFTLEQFDHFLFAFDGVILDSAELTVSAFGELYADHGDDVRGMVEAYRRAHPGEPRHEQVRMLHRTLLGEELSPAETSMECDKLGEIILDDMIDCPLMPDIAEALQLLNARGIAAHIVSSMPQDELRTIVARKGLTRQFRSVLGAPLSQGMNCEAIFAASRADRARCLFVGATMADYRCATNVGVPFLEIGEFATAPFPFGTHVTERLGDLFLDVATARLGRAFPPSAPVELGRRFRAV